MIDPDEFDAFYKDARDRLLWQTYALTGDLKASRSAVRDSFVVAWHHWRKVSRLAEPESYVRPQAWSHAQRRHTARIWHRDKSLDADATATFDALNKLPMVQRKALVLTHLAAVSMSDLARELGLPRAEAERQLQTATAQFAVHRDVRTTHIRTLFEQLRQHVDEGQWPRPSILRRAGAGRRRTHTIVGAAVAVAAVIVTGAVVTDSSGARPTLGREAQAAATTRDLSPDEPARTEAPPPEFDSDVLLTAEQVQARVPGKGWTAGETTDNTEGKGIVAPCQRERFADPEGRATLVRTFGTGDPGRAEGQATKRGKGRDQTGPPSPSAVQVAELSTTARSARSAFDTTVGWYAACTEPRVQLIATKQVEGLADEARLLVLRAWDQPGWTYVAGVARTGLFTTSTVTRTPVGAAPALPQAARLLAGAVTGLCDQPDAGACLFQPRVRPIMPEPAGAVPGMLGEVDLPPVSGIVKPWVGTEPRRAMANVAATSCDQADFSVKGMTHNLTRSFLIPEARLPDAFGLTESVGTFPARRATAFVEQVRQRMASCPDRDLGTEVSRLAHVDSRDRDLTVWRVTTELSDDESVTFLMGIARRGEAVGQVGFVPAGKVTMGPETFVSLVERAAERLPAMPAA